MNHFKKKENQIAVQLFDSCDHINEVWDELLPADHFLKKQQLCLYETMQLPDVSFLYALISFEDKIVAVAYFQLLTIKQKHLDTDNLKSYQQFGWKFLTKTICPKLLIAGHLFRHDIDSFYSVSEASSFESFHYYQSAINAAMKKSHAKAALVKDMPDDLIAYFQNYAPEYLLLRNDINMEMEISNEWKEIIDYEKALKHKYAQRFRKVRQPWDKLEINELSVDEVEKNKEIIYDLYEQVTVRQQVRLGLLSKDYLPMLKKNNPESLRIWLAYEEEKPVAFFSAWEQEEIFDMFYIGFDYSRNDDMQLYFNILFFSIEQAIISRKKKLILGRTALEAKARLGCKPSYLSTYLYIKNRSLGKIISGLQQNITSQEGEWENRHPFKK